MPDRTVGQWRNLRATRHVFFPEEARRWMLFHVFDRADRTRQLANGVRYPNPTTHSALRQERAVLAGSFLNSGESKVSGDSSRLQSGLHQPPTSGRNTFRRDDAGVAERFAGSGEQQDDCGYSRRRDDCPHRPRAGGASG